MSSLSKTTETIKIPLYARPAQHAVVGAGPSGMQVVLNLLDQGIKPKNILWLDEHFKCGAFQSQLADIDGNTTIHKYKDTFRKMFAILRKFAIETNEDDFILFKSSYHDLFAAMQQQGIALSETARDIVGKYPNIENYCCPLAIITPVLQHISDHLRQLVISVQGLVIAINNTKKFEIDLEVVSLDQRTKTFKARSVIMALGAIPRTLKDLEGFDPTHSKVRRELMPWLAFSMPALEKLFIQSGGKIKKIVIIGESHSGALIHKNTMLVSDRLEKLGLPRVTAHTLAADMPKFRYTDTSGKVINNNNGLDGNSAHFIAGMIFDAKLAAKYADQWQYQTLSRKITFDDIPDEEGTYIVCAIGFKPPENIRINGQLLNNFIKKHPMGGSFENRIFLGGFTSPVLDEYGIANVGLTKVLTDSQRLAQLAIIAEHGNGNAFFILPASRDSSTTRAKLTIDDIQGVQLIRAKL